MPLPLQVSRPRMHLSELAPSRVRDADVLAVPVLADDADHAGGGLSLGPGAAELVADLDSLDLFALLATSRADGHAGELVSVPLVDGRLLLLVGCGAGGTDDLRRAGAVLARASHDRVELATSVAAVSGDDGLGAFVEGLVLGSFDFHWRSAGPPHHPVERVRLCALPGVPEATLATALAVADAAWAARWWACVPSNLKNPAWMAEQAAGVAVDGGLDIEVFDELRLAQGGFGGLEAVGRASATPPRLVRLDYTPDVSRRAAKALPHVVLVGKGITFDTGGLSIKTGESMVTMKRDMTGAAVVLATMGALRAIDCPVRVTGLLALAENAVGGNAMRPGDVLRHYGGRTTEVTNTDAEGRLVLADALAYADAELEPDAMVDVATLTGGVKVALGQRLGGLFANDEALAAALDGAGTSAGEPMWRLPLSEEYEPRLASKVADADNAPGGPQAVMAALFLQHFAGGRPWAHLDIASVGDSPTESFEWSLGPTGFGVRLLLRWLGTPAPLAGVGGD